MYSKWVIFAILLLSVAANSAISCENSPHDKSVYLQSVAVKTYEEAGECSDFTLLLKDRHPTKDQYLHSVHIDIKAAKGEPVVNFSPSLNKVTHGYLSASFCLQNKFLDSTSILVHSKTMGSAELAEGGMKIIGSPSCIHTEVIPLKKAISSNVRSSEQG